MARFNPCKPKSPEGRLAAVPMPDEEEEAVGLGGSGFGGGGGGLGGSLSAQFESLLETAPEHTQTQRGPAAALSGVSSGVAKYFAAAFGSAESQDTAFVFKQLCTANRCARARAPLASGSCCHPVLTSRTLASAQAEQDAGGAAVRAGAHPCQQRLHLGTPRPAC